MNLPLQAVPFVGALVLLIAGLAANVSRIRMRVRVRLGDGGDKGLGYAIRAHGNALEHGILLAVALVLAEVTGLPVRWVIGLGWLILAARLAHAAGFLRFGRKVVVPAATLTYLLELGLGGYLVSAAFR
jgi:uncharacterized membrane protein YecN with MAPEG domain